MPLPAALPLRGVAFVPRSSRAPSHRAILVAPGVLQGSRRGFGFRHRMVRPLGQLCQFASAIAWQRARRRLASSSRSFFVSLRGLFLLAVSAAPQSLALGSLNRWSRQRKQEQSRFCLGVLCFWARRFRVVANRSAASGLFASGISPADAAGCCCSINFCRESSTVP